MKSAEAIIRSHQFYATKVSGSKSDGYGVLIKDKSSDFSKWVDVYIVSRYLDVQCDWNQFIFHTDDLLDSRDMVIMGNPNVADDAFNEAIHKLLKENKIMQNEKGNWSYC